MFPEPKAEFSDQRFGPFPGPVAWEPQDEKYLIMECHVGRVSLKLQLVKETRHCSTLAVHLKSTSICDSRHGVPCWPGKLEKKQGPVISRAVVSSMTMKHVGRGGRKEHWGEETRTSGTLR